jgi:hypothetical protein
MLYYGLIKNCPKLVSTLGSQRIRHHKPSSLQGDPGDGRVWAMGYQQANFALTSLMILMRSCFVSTPGRLLQNVSLRFLMLPEEYRWIKVVALSRGDLTNSRSPKYVVQEARDRFSSANGDRLSFVWVCWLVARADAHRAALAKRQDQPVVSRLGRASGVLS